MEIKKWTYEEFPEFTEEVEGAERISTTGEEMGVRLHLDVEYARKDGEILHLQILEPYCRKDAERIYPCLLYVQGSAWFKQNVYTGIPLLTNLAKKGYVIAVVEYRHSGNCSISGTDSGRQGCRALYEDSRRRVSCRSGKCVCWGKFFRRPHCRVCRNAFRGRSSGCFFLSGSFGRCEGNSGLLWSCRFSAGGRLSLHGKPSSAGQPGGQASWRYQLGRKSQGI